MDGYFDYGFGGGYDDDGMTIERISESEAQEYADIEGTDDYNADHAGQEAFDPNEVQDAPAGPAVSSPDDPLYDENGNLIPYGFTEEDWEKKQKAAAESRKRAAQRARTEERLLLEEEMRLFDEQRAEAAAYAQQDLTMQHDLLGHGEDNFVEEQIPTSEEYTPVRWQEEYDYQIDPEAGTITLNSYHGSSDVAVVPSVAYGEDGTAYGVRLSDETPVFNPEAMSYVGISDGVPEEVFEAFTHAQTGISYEEYLQEHPVGMTGTEDPISEEQKRIAEGESEQGGYDAADTDTEPSYETYDEPASPEQSYEQAHESEISVQDNLEEESTREDYAPEESYSIAYEEPGTTLREEPAPPTGEYSQNPQEYAHADTGYAQSEPYNEDDNLYYEHPESSQQEAYPHLTENATTAEPMREETEASEQDLSMQHSLVGHGEDNFVTESLQAGESARPERTEDYPEQAYQRTPDTEGTERASTDDVSYTVPYSEPIREDAERGETVHTESPYTENVSTIQPQDRNVPVQEESAQHIIAQEQAHEPEQTRGEASAQQQPVVENVHTHLYGESAEAQNWSETTDPSYHEQSAGKGEEVIDNALTAGARNNFVRESTGGAETEHSEPESSKVDQLRSIDTRNAYQMPDKFNDSKSDVSENRSAEVKDTLNHADVAQAGPVLMAGATAFDSDTSGSYSSGKMENDVLLSGTGQQAFFNSVFSDAPDDTVKNHHTQDDVISVKNITEAADREKGNYKEEEQKTSKDRADEQKAEKDYGAQFTADVSFDKDSVSQSAGKGAAEISASKKEDVTEIQSRKEETGAKKKIRDTQKYEDALAAAGGVAVQVVKSSANSEENDVERGANKMRRMKRDIDLFFGASGFAAAASLARWQGFNQELAAEKILATKELKFEEFIKIADYKTAAQNYMAISHTNGVKGKILSAQDYKSSTRDFSQYLQVEHGWTTLETKALFSKGPDGRTIAQNIADSAKSRDILLRAASKDSKLFTKEELAFLKSTDYFNTGKNSVQINSLHAKYLARSENAALKKINPAQEYVSKMRAGDQARFIRPDVLGQKGAVGKIDVLIDPKGYNLRPNLDKKMLELHSEKQLRKLVKKDAKGISPDDLHVAKQSIRTAKAGQAHEKNKNFKKNKHSVKNISHISLTLFQRLDSDATEGLKRVLYFKNTMGTVYSVMKTGLIASRILGKGGMKAVRFVGRKTGATKFIAKKKAEIVKAVKKSKPVKTAKATIKKAGSTKIGTATKKGISSVKKGANSVKKTVGKGKNFVNGKREIKKAKKNARRRAINNAKKKLYKKAMQNRFIATVTAPFRAASFVLGKASMFLKKILAFFAKVGHYICVAIAMLIIVDVILLALCGFMKSLANMFDALYRMTVVAEDEDIEEWVKKYLKTDDERFNEAVRLASEEPEDSYVWGGVKLYHYGVYEPTYTTYFNRNNTNCYYHEKTGNKNYRATNGYHIIYIDKDGNTIGTNTSNVKDVISLGAVLVDNDYDQYRDEAEALQDFLYEMLNPGMKAVESEIYVCSQGCDTFPQHYVDGDPANGNNWYSNSAYKAYECNNYDIYREFRRLQTAGVKFFTYDTYDYYGKTYQEALVSYSGTLGCNSQAKATTHRDKITDGYWEIFDYFTIGAIRFPDYSTAVYHPATYSNYVTLEVEYFCEGSTVVYQYNEDGYYYLNRYGTSLFVSNYLEENYGESIAFHGYYGRYSRDYSSNIPHTAIKCCYGHRDLNVYITVLTYEDVIDAQGGAIIYRQPVEFSKETGAVTRWEYHTTGSLNSYIHTSDALMKATEAFYARGGFSNEEVREQVDDIYGEDWYELYGVNVYEGAALPDAVTRSQTTDRLSYTELEDVSAVRKSLVTTAYYYVGKIPYYWGGKASSVNVWANNFGSTVPADSMGRTKKGLDCSGFVQLMYCNASGKSLSEVGSTTSNFVSSLGLSRISYDQLQPGDIGLMALPGSKSNHIGIYAGNGMWIHCTGSPTNTVVYNNTNVFRYYYSLGG